MKSKTIFLVLNGGLGNQMFQVAAALSAANSRDIVLLNRWGNPRKDSEGKVEVDSLAWGNYTIRSFNDLCPRYLHKGFNLALKLGANRNRRLSLRIVLLALNFISTIYLKRIIKIKVCFGLGYDDFSKSDINLLVGYFQSYRYFESLKLEPKLVRIRESSANLLKLIEKIKKEIPIVLHVRRGDYKTEKFGLIGEEYYVNALNTLGVHNNSRIWVFSDDLSDIRDWQLFRKFQNTFFVEDGQLSSAEIFELMRYGSHHVIANSSFSWWSATLRYDYSTRVIAPTPWFLGENSPHLILDPTWEVQEWSNNV